jgi:lipoic acid synthetase
MRIRWLGHVPYAEAWDLQRAIAGRSEADYLLLLEHPPVYTLGVNADPGHVLVDPQTVGADVVRVDRGGDVTFHGPGQLVGYPIVSVGEGPHRGTEHVRRIEQVIIDVLVELGLRRDDVGRLPDGDAYGAAKGVVGPRKVCAIGVRTARGRTTHGFALNVDPDLAFFGHIVPCGIADRPVTSLAAEGWTGTMADVVEVVVQVARRQWDPDADFQAVTDRRAPASQVGTPGPATVGAAGEPVHLGPRRGAALAAPDTPPATALERRLARSGVAPGSGLGVGERKPDWLRVPARMGDEFLHLRHGLRARDLVTVCEEAGCPNIYECWSAGTATFMINGDRCTRACGFCQVSSEHPRPLDATEPERVAEATSEMGLAHAVVTCVARDDLDDGGAGAFAATIAAIRGRSPRTTVEVLISDCRGRPEALGVIFEARPDVLNHNIETVARLQYAVRPSAGYARSLAVLARAKDASLTTKSGIIVGMGERTDEVVATLTDLRAVGVDIVTVGQYLRPSAAHVPVARYWTPDEFDELRAIGQSLGFAHVQASPLTRSSYHAREAAESAVSPMAAPLAGSAAAPSAPAPATG